MSLFSLKGVSRTAGGRAIIWNALKGEEWSDGLALQVSTEIGVGQLVQICIKRSGCIAIEEGFGGQNGANDMVKRFVTRGLGRIMLVRGLSTHQIVQTNV